MSLWTLQRAQHAFQDGREADGLDEWPQGSESAMGLMESKKETSNLPVHPRLNGHLLPGSEKAAQKAALVPGSHLEQHLFPNLLNHAPPCFGGETCK